MKAVKEYVIFYLIDREDQSEYSTLTGQRALDTNLWLNKPWAKLKKKKKKGRLRKTLYTLNPPILQAKTQHSVTQQNDLPQNVRFGFVAQRWTELQNPSRSR